MKLNHPIGDLRGVLLQSALNRNSWLLISSLLYLAHHVISSTYYYYCY